MATTTTPLQEKLTLFWHGHFATANYKVDDMRLMYQQNASVPVDARPATSAISCSRCRSSPRCSSGSTTTRTRRASPNENFARELMELFTLGVDQYTQADVVASARAWTGHNTLDDDRTQYHFYPNRHDTGLKTFMGVTQNWDGPDIIDFILARRRDAQADRGTVHRHEDVDVLRLPESRAPESSPTSPTRSSPHDLSIAELVRAIFNHPNFLSPAGDAAASCVTRPNGSSACMRGREHDRRGREPAVVRWRTWASSCSSRRTCRAGDRTSTG